MFNQSMATKQNRADVLARHIDNAMKRQAADDQRMPKGKYLGLYLCRLNKPFMRRGV